MTWTDPDGNVRSPEGLLLPGKRGFIARRMRPLIAVRDIVGTYMGATVAMWQSRANQAYDGGAWGAGNLWSADAHSDPNVYTNRYNDGVAAATPPGAPLTFSGTFSGLTAVGSPQNMIFAAGSGSLTFAGVGGSALTVPKTGRYAIYAQGNSNDGVWGNNSSVRLNLVTTRGTTYGAKSELHDNWDDGGNGNGHDGGNHCVCNVTWTGTLYAGDLIYVQVQTFASSPPSVAFPADINTYTIEFIPTPSYPH